MKNTLENRQLTIQWLHENSGWNNFAASLVDQLDRKGDLSAKQMTAALAMVEKFNKPKAEKEYIDLTAILALLNNAKISGVKKPTLYIGELKIREGKRDCIYIYDAGTYSGKISAAGEWLPGRNARKGIIDELRAIALNPLTAAVEHGKATGQCSCCGRKLTNKNSIAMGIGPICAAKWGLAPQEQLI